MATTILHDTALAALADGDTIFLYFQLSDGSLCEAILIPGQPQVGYIITNLSAAFIKLYTPLAAAFGKKQERYLFYIDTDGILNNAVYNGDTWSRGFLRNQSITPAHYSKLAAAKSSVCDDEIHVFYQTTDRSNGAIRQVTGYENRWTPDRRDFGDRVLTGTGLAAVHAELGINISTASDKPPVVFFQQTNLGLAWLQETVTRKIDGVETKASPHTPLAATDAASTNLKDVFLFYTSNANEIERLAINSKGQDIGPTDLTGTTPKGNLAAVVLKSLTTDVEEVIVFYQLAKPTTIQQYTAARYSSDNCVCRTRYTVTRSGGVAKLSTPQLDHVEMRFA